MASRCDANRMRSPSDPAPRLATFRQSLYDRTLGRRKDTLFEILDAVLTWPGRESLVQRTRSPLFHRGWSSASDALCDGTLDEAACRQLCVVSLTDPSTSAPDPRPIWALDGTSWPRPRAVTSPERTWNHQPSSGLPDHGIMAGWDYHWLVAIPAAHQSWMLPLDVARRGPDTGTPTTLALRQLRRVVSLLPAGVRPVVTADSTYDPIELALAVQQDLEVDVLVRLNGHRLFTTQPPPPVPGARGHARWYGDPVRLWQPEDLPDPDDRTTIPDARHGTIEVAVWRQMLQRPHRNCPVTLVRVQAAHRPRSARHPAPLWLLWAGKEEPEDLGDLWRWYAHRFAIEAGFRLLKQTFGWTAIRLRQPAAADRWTWLIALAQWQLWLAREMVADARLPWERVMAPEQLTPGRVLRALGPLLAHLGSPARPVTLRGKSPGRRSGQCPGPAPRYPVQHRRAPPASITT